MTLKSKRTKIIKTEAERFGFISCGISKAEFLEDHASNLEKWLKKNYVNVKIIFLGKSYGNSSKEIINKFNQIDKDILMYKEQTYISEANFLIQSTLKLFSNIRF